MKQSLSLVSHWSHRHETSGPIPGVIPTVHWVGSEVKAGDLKSMCDLLQKENSNVKNDDSRQARLYP